MGLFSPNLLESTYTTGPRRDHTPVLSEHVKSEKYVNQLIVGNYSSHMEYLEGKAPSQNTEYYFPGFGQYMDYGHHLLQTFYSF